MRLKALVLTAVTLSGLVCAPLAAAGEMIDPSVSVPTDTATRLAATAMPEPELDPPGVRSSTCGLRA